MRWYYWASFFFVLLGMQPLSVVDRLLYGEWSGKEGDKFTQGLNVLLILISVALVVRGYRRLKAIRVGAGLALGLASLFIISGLWSIAPTTSIRAGVVYFFVVLGAIGVATNLKSDEYLGLVESVCFWSAIASLVLLVVDRPAALGMLGQDFPDFRGVFSQKNVLGEAMTMGALASLHGLRIRKRGRWFSLVSLVLAFSLAAMAKSATSCMAIIMFCALNFLVSLILKGGAARSIAIGIIVLVFPVMLTTILAPDAFLELIGKDPTLTGRTDIWALVLADIFQRPGLGWGYLAFWSLDNPAAFEISQTLRWVVPQAHNGLLEILLSVGFIGALLIIFMLGRTIRLSIACMGTNARPLGVTCFLSSVGIILVGTSEAVLINPFEASTGVFILTGFFCEQALKAARSRARRRSSADRSVLQQSSNRGDGVAAVG